MQYYLESRAVQALQAWHEGMPGCPLHRAPLDEFVGLAAQMPM